MVLLWFIEKKSRNIIFFFIDVFSGRKVGQCLARTQGNMQNLINTLS
jgi:hypothetical protein